MIEEKINNQKVKVTPVEFSATSKWVRYSGLTSVPNEGGHMLSDYKYSIIFENINTKTSFKSLIDFTLKKALTQRHADIENRNLELAINSDSSCPLVILESIPTLWNHYETQMQP